VEATGERQKPSHPVLTTPDDQTSSHLTPGGQAAQREAGAESETEEGVQDE